MTGTGSDTIACPHCGKRNRVPEAATGTPRCGNCHEPLPWITDANDDSFAGIVEAAPLPVLVDMWAAWCGPCRVVSPALEQVARDLAGSIKLVKVDVDASPKTAARFGIQAIPNLLVISDGEVKAQRAGAASAASIRQWVTDAISRVK